MIRWIAVACIVLLANGCAQQRASSTDGKATMVRIIDGDTIVVHIGAHEETTRILGIDTPTWRKHPD